MPICFQRYRAWQKHRNFSHRGKWYTLLCTTFGKESWSWSWEGKFSSPSAYGVIRGTISDRFSTVIVISAAWLSGIDLNGEMHYLGQTTTGSDFWHCILALQRQRSLTLSVPYLPVLAKFAIYGASQGPGSEGELFFLHVPVSRVSWPLPFNRGHWRSLALGDFSGESDAILFWNVTRHNYCSIKLPKNASFVQKWRGYAPFNFHFVTI